MRSGQFPLLLLGGMIFGCASPATLRIQMPYLDLDSTSPAKEVAACIAHRWESSGTTGTALRINMKSSPSGYTVNWSEGDRTFVLTDVDDRPDGSSIRYFRLRDALYLEGFDAAVMLCR